MSSSAEQQQLAATLPTMEKVKKLSAAYLEHSAAYVKVAEAKDKAKAYAQADTYDEEYDDDDDADNAQFYNRDG
ncbi:hypothetical protein UCRNP2_2730 [Neofusicoccum parvum UCRNP2]|uniref:Uncharacterized protein n=1 Tax=Botryosphaeria parva (strain UCR-NP2) TaxID=1287680 RepID=R1ERW6_BOTPV|nr:hypothetical protein UCRNP2_2730 [Neofusicoccum parvum UCRNP2]